MPVTYPHAIDELHPSFTSKRALNQALLSLEQRIGTYRDPDPASIEDRLHTVEKLLYDAITRLEVLIKASPGVRR